ncbi:hypothetical protein CU669_02855 [Paramagnetospirillum kuznetsovii]|uniref:Response regulatory domain-containing protein n=1 Tax=Paramagnetospirillum kuznetsovii TaxID=2053833 RepID=A0A364P1C3_9PROT|nr:pentapeptide repeat-containing protein [Paramagnetospirillum kuznetsovii]RAU23121.1 hypothetical protein CU669_02855 [Paramagnetospirillum kuznetsovii]
MRHPTVGSHDTDWKNVRILVFGQDDQFRFLARQTFRKLMVRDVTAFSEIGDIPLLLGRGVDLLLVDLGGKAADGLAVIEKLRLPKDNPHGAVPVLVVVPPSQKDDAERAKMLGIEGVIPKPVSGHELAHRAADTLANPQRMAPPAVAPPKPKLNAIKTPDPLPDLGVKPGQTPVVVVPDQPKEAIPEVAALAERLAARAAGSPPSPANPDRAERTGPWSGMVKPEAPATVSAAPSPAKPAQPAAPRPAAPAAPRPAAPHPVATTAATTAAPAPSPRPATGGGFAGGDLAQAAKRPSGGSLDLDDLAPIAKKPGGGKLELDDLAPLKASGGKLSDADMAPVKPDLEAEAKRRAAEKRRQQWKDAMEASGHKARKGGDVATLDLSAVVAEHAQWLQTSGAEGKRATFVGMDLAGADLSGALLPNATFKEVDLSDACLADARLDGSDFRYAKMEATDLGGANLGVAALRHAKLRLCNLEGAVLRGTDLSGATLTGARMAGADFKGAILIGADLREADLSKVEGLTQGQVEKSLCDLATRMPPGISRPARD